MLMLMVSERNQIHPRILTLKSPVKLESTKQAWLNSKAHLDHYRAPVSRCSLRPHHIKVINTRWWLWTTDMFNIINISHQLRWCPEPQPSHSWFRVGSLDPPAGFTDTINSQKLLRRVLPIFTMWFSFVEDLGHTLSATTQDIRCMDRRYWSYWVS